MRLLQVADLHYALPQFDWVLEIAADFDIVVIAGDHLDLSALVDGRSQSLIVRKYFERLQARTTLVVCSGNHDLDSSNQAGEKIARWLSRPHANGIKTDGDSFVVGDTKFTICPWWDGPVTRAAIAEQLAAAAGERPQRWIWIHHAPPDKSPISWGGARYFGDVELREWIDRYAPDIVLSGHVHQSPFTKDGSWVDRIGSSWVFNAGHQFGAPPCHIIIDTDAGEAVWFSAAGNEHVALEQPLTRPVPKLDAIPDWLRTPPRPQQF